VANHPITDFAVPIGHQEPLSALLVTGRCALSIAQGTQRPQTASAHPPRAGAVSLHTGARTNDRRF
jgi:hypothetical protein